MPRLLLCALLLLMAVPPRAGASVVAILFDDSGSMGGKMHLPAFGAQLLVSALDGRDRLVTARMSDNGTPRATQRPDISTRAAQADLLKDIAAHWPVPAKGTPYAQVSLLLHEVARLQRPGEGASLVVFTDGEFSEPLPPIAAALDDYRAIKSELKGPLRVDYVVIGPDDASDQPRYRGLTVGQVVDRQGYRDALLRLFNGDAADGRHDVSNALDLTEAIKTVVARTAAVDRVRLERSLVRRGREIRIASPLAIHGIVTIASARDGEPLERPDAARLGAREVAALPSEMRRNDARGAWANQRLLGQATHMLFDPPLPAGEHVLVFDGPAERTLVLPHTAARIEVSLLDAGGAALPPGPDGVVTLGEGADVRLSVEVTDEGGHGVERVPASRLGGVPAFTLKDERGGRDGTLTPALDAATDRVVAPLPTTEGAEGRVSATIRVGGVETASEPLRYRVVPAADAVPSLAVRPAEACGACAPGEIGIAPHVGAPGAPGALGGVVASVDVSFAAPVAGRVELRLTAEDDALRLDGQAARDAAVTLDVPAGPGRTVTLPMRLVAAPDALILKRKRRYAFTLEARAVGPLAGAARREGALVLAMPRPALVPDGNSQDATGAKRLSLDLDALGAGAAHEAFAFKDVVGDPVAGTVEASDERWFLRYRARVSGGRLIVTPEPAFLCGCLLAFDQGPRELRVEWTDAAGLQGARAAVTLDVAIPWSWQGAGACGRLVLLALLAAYLLRGALVAGRTRVFPKGAGLDFSDQREDPRFIAFPSGWARKVLAFLFPFGNTNQRATIEGLRLEANRGGALVLLGESDQGFRFENVDETIAEMREAAPKRRSYPMTWNEKARSKSAGRRVLHLLRKASDRHGGRY